MKIKLFLLLTVLAWLPALADTGLVGKVIDASSNKPVADATVMLDSQGLTATTGPDGAFAFTNAKAGSDNLIVIAYGYKDATLAVNIVSGEKQNLGEVKLSPEAFNAAAQDYQNTVYDNALTASQLEDEEGNTQSVALLSGASDDPFYQAASYNFSIMRFRLRGYESNYTTTAINGVNFNDAARGQFNYSMLGGLNQAFKSKSIGQGLEYTSYAFGDIGGANNIYTFAKDFAPGFRGSVAYTNGNYKTRVMATYSTGLNKQGWAMTVSAVGRYADEGITPGSFYNSAGYFLAVQKVLNSHHSIALTTFGAPTKRAGSSATFLEACDLAGSNLYNPNWGWQDGKKRNAKVVESFTPTTILNWVWDKSLDTKLTTGIAFQKSYYSSSALNWYNARDPRPDYYRYLPSYWSDQSIADYYTDLWTRDDSFRQINWNELYSINALNNHEADMTGVSKGSTYILEKRHSNQAAWIFNTNLNTRLSNTVTLQGGLNANYTVSSYYKTVKDLLGGRYWLDVDQFSERDFPGNNQILQNDIDNPNRKVLEGDRFGYDYNINSLNTNLWVQNVVNLAKFDINYAADLSYTMFQRDGKMRNGRAPENSYGKGDTHKFVNFRLKAGAVYKLDGRNSFSAHAFYGTVAPRPYNAYISPRIKDDVITGLESEKISSFDLDYTWNYRTFRGSITAYWTEFRDGNERTSFYDDLYRTAMNYSLINVHKAHRGIELGFSYKLTPSLAVSGAATFSRYTYKNRPTGTRSYENGSQPDTTQIVYLKNFYVGETPQQAYSLSLNWTAPHMWFFEINGSWLGDAYVDLSPIRHEAMPNLWTVCETIEQYESKVKEITHQERLKDAFVLNASIGKVIYLNRTASLNFNVNLNNILNNRNIMTGGYQQGRFDYTNYTTSKYPNKYYFTQGFKIYVNMGVRF